MKHKASKRFLQINPTKISKYEKKLYKSVQNIAPKSK